MLFFFPNPYVTYSEKKVPSSKPSAIFELLLKTKVLTFDIFMVTLRFCLILVVMELYI